MKISECSNCSSVGFLKCIRLLNSIQKVPDALTTGYGVPVDTKTCTMTVGPRGPILLQDVQFLDEMSHFDRERIPERVVHAKGGGAFGYFQVTHDVTKYCKAKIFDRIGKRTPCVVRFSTVGMYNHYTFPLQKYLH